MTNTSFKTLFEFSINKTKEVEDSQKQKNEKGEEITITQKVKKEVPVKVLIKQPNMGMREDASLYYSVRLNEGIKIGLLTEKMLEKRLLNDGGILSDGEKKEWEDLIKNLAEKQTEYQKTLLKQENEKTKEDEEKVKKLLEEMFDIRGKIQQLQSIHSTLFDHTAENYAKNKTIIWYIIQLSYLDEGNGPKPFMGEGDFDTRLKRYYEIDLSSNDEETVFVKKVNDKLAFSISLWLNGYINNQEDFSKIEGELLK